VNVERPLPDRDPDPDHDKLDEYLAAIDAELDAVFLDEIDGVLRRVRVEPDAKPDAATT
jgi:hypothetical protein